MIPFDTSLMNQLSKKFCRQFDPQDVAAEARFAILHRPASLLLASGRARSERGRLTRCRQLEEFLDGTLNEGELPDLYRTAINLVVNRLWNMQRREVQLEDLHQAAMNDERTVTAAALSEPDLPPCRKAIMKALAKMKASALALLVAGMIHWDELSETEARSLAPDADWQLVSGFQRDFQEVPERNKKLRDAGLPANAGNTLNQRYAYTRALLARLNPHLKGFLAGVGTLLMSGLFFTGFGPLNPWDASVGEKKPCAESVSLLASRQCMSVDDGGGVGLSLLASRQCMSLDDGGGVGLSLLASRQCMSLDRGDQVSMSVCCRDGHACWGDGDRPAQGGSQWRAPSVAQKMLRHGLITMG